MIKSSSLRSCSSPLILDAKHHPKPSSSSSSSTISCSSRSQAYIPKLEPFSRSKFERALKDPPLIQKSEKELADYCSTLEGEESYGCWQAYFELKDLEKESPKADIERLILETGELVDSKQGKIRECPIPDGLPKPYEEMLEEEESKMPDSPFTRLLRSKGRHPAWYSPVPDHQSD
ncbi:CCG-binding protein 1 [Senna tora]|uniref:CCG-binding protein 1 n=1 Tax=Senna tora TaxID=362788 RepID=A0A834XAV2_9FABA|nr:CCG-binding protein 1 [Senna tora]